MDNCDLEKLCVSAGKLRPSFTPEVTDYKVTVESSVNEVTLDVMTSDCGASYSIVSKLYAFYFSIQVSFASNLALWCLFQLFGDRSNTITLKDGLNRVGIEVVAEDGTIKKYSVEITKLSAKIAELSNLALEGDISLHPAFCSNVFEYNSEYSLSVLNKKLYVKCIILCFVFYFNWYTKAAAAVHMYVNVCMNMLLSKWILFKNAET